MENAAESKWQDGFGKRLQMVREKMGISRNVGHTHLGHGPKATIQGHFADEDGWNRLLEASRNASPSC